jgi:hypothetical protein
MGSGKQGLVTFEDIVGAWEAAKGMRRGQRLVLVVDACYSGKLVAKLRDMPNGRKEGLGIAIQAAGNARQQVVETAANHAGREWLAGAFTGYWVPKQTNQVTSRLPVWAHLCMCSEFRAHCLTVSVGRQPATPHCGVYGTGSLDGRAATSSVHR